MKFPEWMYRLLPGDQGTQLLSIRWRTGANIELNATVRAGVILVPNDKVLVLTNASAIFDPGAGQVVTRRRIMIDSPLSADSRFDLRQDLTTGALNATLGLDWQGEVVIPPGWALSVEGQFDAAVAANRVDCWAHGFLIPRGTFIVG